MEQLIGTLLRAKVWHTQDGIELYNGDQANTLPYRLVAYKLSTQEDLSTSRLDLLE